MDTKIEVFKFLVSDFGYRQKNDYLSNCMEQKTEEEIKREVNNFMKGKKIIDFKQSTINIGNHSDIGAKGSNRIELIYTILYSE